MKNTLSDNEFTQLTEITNESLKNLKKLLENKLSDFRLKEKYLVNTEQDNGHRNIEVVDRLYRCNTVCMQEVSHILHLWGMDGVADVMIQVFDVYRDMYTYMVDMYVSSCDHVKEYQNKQIRMISYRNSSIVHSFKTDGVRSLELTQTVRDAKGEIGTDINDGGKRKKGDDRSGKQVHEEQVMFNFADAEQYEKEEEEKRKILVEKAKHLKLMVDSGRHVDYSTVSEPKLLIEINKLISSDMLSHNAEQQKELDLLMKDLDNVKQVKGEAHDRISQIVSEQHRFATLLGINSMDVIDIDMIQIYNDMTDAEREMLQMCSNKHKELFVKLLKQVKRTKTNTFSRCDMTAMTSKDIDRIADIKEVNHLKTSNRDMKMKIEKMGAAIEAHLKEIESLKSKLRLNEVHLKDKDKQIGEFIDTLSTLKLDINLMKNSKNKVDLSSQGISVQMQRLVRDNEDLKRMVNKWEKDYGNVKDNVYSVMMRISAFTSANNIDYTEENIVNVFFEMINNNIHNIMNGDGNRSEKRDKVSSDNTSHINMNKNNNMNVSSWSSNLASYQQSTQKKDEATHNLIFDRQSKEKEKRTNGVSKVVRNKETIQRSTTDLAGKREEGYKDGVIIEKNIMVDLPKPQGQKHEVKKQKNQYHQKQQPSKLSSHEKNREIKQQSVVAEETIEHLESLNDNEDSLEMEAREPVGEETIIGDQMKSAEIKRVIKSIEPLRNQNDMMIETAETFELMNKLKTSSLIGDVNLLIKTYLTCKKPYYAKMIMTDETIKLIASIEDNFPKKPVTLEISQQKQISLQKLHVSKQDISKLDSVYVRGNNTKDDYYKSHMKKDEPIPVKIDKDHHHHLDDNPLQNGNIPDVQTKKPEQKKESSSFQNEPELIDKLPTNVEKQGDELVANLYRNNLFSSIWNITERGTKLPIFDEYSYISQQNSKMQFGRKETVITATNDDLHIKVKNDCNLKLLDNESTAKSKFAKQQEPRTENSTLTNFFTNQPHISNLQPKEYQNYSTKYNNEKKPKIKEIQKSKTTREMPTHFKSKGGNTDSEEKQKDFIEVQDYTEKSNEAIRKIEELPDERVASASMNQHNRKLNHHRRGDSLDFRTTETRYRNPKLNLFRTATLNLFPKSKTIEENNINQFYIKALNRQSLDVKQQNPTNVSFIPCQYHPKDPINDLHSIESLKMIYTKREKDKQLKSIQIYHKDHAECGDVCPHLQRTNTKSMRKTNNAKWLQKVEEGELVEMKKIEIGSSIVIPKPIINNPSLPHSRQSSLSNTRLQNIINPTSKRIFI